MKVRRIKFDRNWPYRVDKLDFLLMIAHYNSPCPFSQTNDILEELIIIQLKITIQVKERHEACY